MERDVQVVLGIAPRGSCSGDHLDWIPALRLAVEGSAADAPFYASAVGVLDETTATPRPRLGLDPVSRRSAEGTVERVGDAAARASDVPVHGNR